MMSPLYIKILLHIYCNPYPYDGDENLSESYNSCIKDLVDKGLIFKTDLVDNFYKSTDRGNCLVDMLCNTPLPEYRDPRGDK